MEEGRKGRGELGADSSRLVSDQMKINDSGTPQMGVLVLSTFGGECGGIPPLQLRPFKMCSHVWKILSPSLPLGHTPSPPSGFKGIIALCRCPPSPTA